MNQKKRNFYIALGAGAAVILAGIVLGTAQIAKEEVPRNEEAQEEVPEMVSGEEVRERPIIEVPEVQILDTEVIAENLVIPWDIAFLPDGSLLVTERPGRLLHIDRASGDRQVTAVSGVEHTGEGGLLGITLHPRFRENGWLYLYMTTRVEDGLRNRVVRYRWANDRLIEPTEILLNIPGAAFHDGGRMEFGPDGYLYIATGDAGRPQLAQDTDSLAGKILRVRDDGSVPDDNPFGNPVYSYGHRNPQGMAWDTAGRLWMTEHGPSGVWPNCCKDEVNLIIAGGNYGWPESTGNMVQSGTVPPALHSGRTTWAPASAAFWDGSVFFGGLRGEALYEAVLAGNRIVELKEHYKDEFGRIRTVRLGPDGMLYLTTSNRDGRGSVQGDDDKIIRLNPEQFRR